MTHLYHIPHESAMDNYRAALTGERLGWVVYRTPTSFAPTHLIRMHPEDGPVAIICDDVFQVDPDEDHTFKSEQEARDWYWTPAGQEATKG